jgi:beta-glucanase (GH16 family)
MVTPAETSPFFPQLPEDQPGLDRRWLLTHVGLIGGALAIGGSLLAGCSGGSEQETTPPAAPASQEVVTSKPDQDKISGEFEAKPGWQIVFKEMANGTPIDENKLRPNLNPAVPTWNDPHEKQAYTKRAENMRVEDGAMVITARIEDYQYPGDDVEYGITSGRLETFNSTANEKLADGLTFNYGKVEIVAKLPEGDGVFAAPLWLVSANSPGAEERVETDLADMLANGEISEDEVDSMRDELWGKYYKMGGELDIESYGKKNKIEVTAHTMSTPEDSGDETTVTVEGATDDYHTYGIEVTPTKVTWTVDGKAVKAFEKKSDNPEEWPFTEDNELYVVTNLAMGGPAGPVDKSKAPWKMHIQSLSYYPLAK